ncbi:MAG: hypothetical protein ABI587_12200 [Gemmatimonadales bacterium]
MRLTLPVLLFAVTTSLAAQVGHDPATSPYRDIPNGKSLTFLIGDVGGDGGKVGVGPHHGRSYGGRLDLRISGPVQFGLGVSQANLERLVVSADDSVAKRTTGPFDQKLTMIEATLQLNITGRKSWHRLAPFVSGTAGWVHGSSLPASAAKDSSGFKFGSKLYFAPTIGLRIIITNNLQLRLDARQLFWKLKYPLSYTQDPIAEPSPNGDLANAVLPDGKREQWSGARELRAGLGFAF